MMYVLIFSFYTVYYILCFFDFITNDIFLYYILNIKYFMLNTSSSRASRGRKFQKKKVVYSKERICLWNARKATDQRDAQTISLL